MGKKRVSEIIAPREFRQVDFHRGPTAPGGLLVGREIKLELINQANGWSWEAGYWAEIALVSR